jgi:hypothetical protein
MLKPKVPLVDLALSAVHHSKFQIFYVEMWIGNYGVHLISTDMLFVSISGFYVSG